MATDVVKLAVRNTAGVHPSAGKGEVFSGDVTVRDIAERNNMVDEVLKQPTYVELPDGTLKLDKAFDLVVADPDTGEWIILDHGVKQRYEPRQFDDLIDIFGPLNDELGLPLEMIGVLKGRKIVFMKFQTGIYEIGGREEETHHQYFFFGARRDGLGSDFGGTTSLRLVCMNQFAAMAAKSVLKIPHYHGSIKEVQFRKAIVEYAVKRQRQEIEALNALFNRKINKEEFADIVDAAFPAPKLTRYHRLQEEAAMVDLDLLNAEQVEAVDHVMAKAKEADANYNWRQQRTMDIRTAVGEAYGEFNDTYPYAAETAYAGFNAVTYVISNNPGDLFTGGESKHLVRQFFGDLQKSGENAYVAAKKLLQLKVESSQYYSPIVL